MGLLKNKLGIFSCIHALVEFVAVQTELCGNRLQIDLAECPLVFAAVIGEKVIVIIPESILVACAFAGFRGPL